MHDLDTVRRWYCVRSTCGHELRAAELLSRSVGNLKAAIGEVDVFCPTLRRHIRVGGHRRQILAPLFPGYFFSRFNLAVAARFIGSRPGVIGLVRFREEPEPVADHVIEELRATDFDSDLLSNKFSPGQHLTVSEGPFAGMDVEYVASLNDGQRALLLVEYLHQRVSLIVEQTSLDVAA
jgi:transcriptional antiterminator RfaH